MDNKIIAAIYKDRDSWEIINKYLPKPEELFSDINLILYEKASEFYDADSSAAYVDGDVVRSYINRTYPKHKEVLEIALDRIESYNGISCNNILKEFIEAKRYAVGQHLASALLNGKDSSALLEEYTNLHRGELDEVASEEATVWKAPKYTEISDMLKDGDIELYPEELQERTKGAMKGNHILIFARPETGKSLFVINMVRGFLEQDLKVLYIGNEDNEKALLPRIFSSITGLTREDMEETAGDAVDRMLEEGGIENFIFIHLEPGTFDQIRGLCSHYSPDVLIVDQIRNIGSSEGLTIAQEKAGTAMRNIGNQYDLLAISVAQAGESANNKLVLGLSDVDSSKTGLPAQVDLMVGIGVTEDYSNRGKRMISLPKNKLSGDHSFFSINVDEKLSRVV